MTGDFEYDDTPYRERRRGLYPALTISVELPADDDDEHGPVWVFVDGADTCIARQRFDEHDYLYNGTYEDWLAALLNGLRNDPEGREQCGDCGNFGRGQHAPNCAYAYMNNL